MPTFNFSINKKKIEKKETSNDNVKHQIVRKDVIGVVWINEKANYFVKNNAILYPIHLDCYSCKNKDRIYTRKLHNYRRIYIIRNVNEYNECNLNLFLPFAPGCIVSGDIVSNNNIKYFYIKKCWLDYDNDESHLAIEFYRNNYDTIVSIIDNMDLNEIR